MVNNRLTVKPDFQKIVKGSFCDRLRVSHDHYACRRSLVVRIGRVEMSSTFPIVTTLQSNKKLYRNTDRRGSNDVLNQGAYRTDPTLV